MERASESGLRGNILQCLTLLVVSSSHSAPALLRKQHRLGRTRVPIEEQMRIWGRTWGYEL